MDKEISLYGQVVGFGVSLGVNNNEGVVVQFFVQGSVGLAGSAGISASFDIRDSFDSDPTLSPIRWRWDTARISAKCVGFN